jgi:hypothetical protein
LKAIKSNTMTVSVMPVRSADRIKDFPSQLCL